MNKLVDAIPSIGLGVLERDVVSWNAQSFRNYRPRFGYVLYTANDVRAEQKVRI